MLAWLYLPPRDWWMIVVGVVVFTVVMVTARIASKLIVNSDVFSHEEQEQIKLDVAFIRSCFETASEEEAKLAERRLDAQANSPNEG